MLWRVPFASTRYSSASSRMRASRTSKRLFARSRTWPPS
jgi:hypothetical protein